MRYGIVLGFVLVALLMAAPASAATVTVSQAGADSGSVMKGIAFTISVTGLSGSGTVSLTNYPSGFSVDEEYSKSFSDGTTSVTWTTATINQKYESAQKITVTIDTLGSPTTADSNSFTVKLPPSLVTSLSPSSVSDNPTGSQTFQLTMQNWGETTANDVSASISLPTGVTTSSSETQTKSTLYGGEGGSGESWGISWVMSYGTMAAGSKTITISVSASNADTTTITRSFTVTSGGGDDTLTPGGPGFSGGPTQNVTNETIEDDGSVTKTYEVPTVDLTDKGELISVLSDILGEITEEMQKSIEQISNQIKQDLGLSKNFRAANGKSTMTVTVTYNGEKTVQNLIIYDKLPKSFAENTADIMVSAPGAIVKIVKEDPEYAFIYPEMDPGQEIVITYDINEEKNSTVMDGVYTEIYAESYKQERLCNPGLKRCNGDALEQCNVEGTGWIKVQDCLYGCDSATLSCKESSTTGAVTAEPSIEGDYTMLLVGVIVLVIIVALTGVFMKKRNKQNSKKPLF